MCYTEREGCKLGWAAGPPMETATAGQGEMVLGPVASLGDPFQERLLSCPARGRSYESQYERRPVACPGFAIGDNAGESEATCSP